MHSLPVFVAGSQTAQSMLPDQLHRRVSSGWLGKGHAEAAQRLAADPPRGNQNRQDSMAGQEPATPSSGRSET